MSPKNMSFVATLVLSPVILLSAQDVPRPKVVLSGQIARVDNALKLFELRSQQEVNNQPTLTDGITLGTTIGKTAPGSRNGIDPIESPRRPIVNEPARPVPAIRTTVFLTDTTVCKDGKKVILCSELKFNDLVLVSGDEKSGPRGFGVYATEIARTKQLR
jgi:hypothetical protein